MPSFEQSQEICKFCHQPMNAHAADCALLEVMKEGEELQRKNEERKAAIKALPKEEGESGKTFEQQMADIAQAHQEIDQESKVKPEENSSQKDKFEHEKIHEIQWRLERMKNRLSYSPFNMGEKEAQKLADLNSEYQTVYSHVDNFLTNPNSNPGELETKISEWDRQLSHLEFGVSWFLATITEKVSGSDWSNSQLLKLDALMIDLYNVSKNNVIGKDKKEEWENLQLKREALKARLGKLYQYINNLTAILDELDEEDLKQKKEVADKILADLEIDINIFFELLKE